MDYMADNSSGESLLMRLESCKTLSTFRLDPRCPLKDRKEVDPLACGKYVAFSVRSCSSVSHQRKTHQQKKIFQNHPFGHCKCDKNNSSEKQQKPANNPPIYLRPPPSRNYRSQANIAEIITPSAPGHPGR